MFESWFRDQNFEGKAGSEPSATELTEALENHDLFLYFGHGSGAQYIPKREIEKLDNCSATFLMEGCNSGSLWLKGCYIPEGIPLSYLLGGSPAIVATLWDVTQTETLIGLGKLCWKHGCKRGQILHQRVVVASVCESLANELAAMNLKGNNTSKRSRIPSSRNKPAQSDVDDGSGKKIECNHKQRRKIGSFIAAARDACTQHLIGAAPVCYGVPTGITRKKGIDSLLPSSSC
ncbi:PREDICTED: separase-like [Camelina sativa]|uniref:separase n=1 Tax=Camelina sativa TaxID=90675 RepID=A0ABM1QPG7_CAMSA|nr:PREDICTED: separase-like [Camelina sativa]